MANLSQNLSVQLVAQKQMCEEQIWDELLDHPDHLLRWKVWNGLRVQTLSDYLHGLRESLWIQLFELPNQNIQAIEEGDVHDHRRGGS